MFSKAELESFKESLDKERLNSQDLQTLTRADFIAWLQEKKQN